MSHKAKIVISRHQVSQGSYTSYIAGFVLSLILTLTAYLLVINQALSRSMLLIAVFSLAVLQFMAQIFFFLHIGQETRPRWKQLSFVFMVGVVLILVLGSIWIMASLDYRHEMSPAETEQQIIKDEGVNP